MSDQISSQQKESSVPIMARVSPDLDRRIEALCKRLGYRNKAVFLEMAVVHQVNRLEAVQLTESALSASPN